MRHLVYKITNKLNQKSYIGKTSQCPKIRWKQHILGMGLGKLMPIHKAIVKYGKDNFDFQVIYSCFNEKDLNYAEVYFINEHASLVPYGYNLDFNVQHLKDNPYLINGNKMPLAVQSIDREPIQSADVDLVEFKLSTRTRYPVELWYKIKSLYDSGMCPKDINTNLEIKIPHRTMISKLQLLGSDTSNKTRNRIRGNLKFYIPDQEKESIVLDFKNGLKTVALEKKYDRTNKTIRQILVQAGVYASRDKKICRTV